MTPGSSVREVLLAALIGTAACAHAPAPADPVRAHPEDPLLALLPSGVEALIDVDLDQWRSWPWNDRLWALLPPSVREGLSLWPPGSAIGAGARRVLVALRNLGDPTPARLLLVLGELGSAPVDGGQGELVTVEYRGVAILQGRDRSLAQVTSEVWASGSAVELRRVIDLAQGQGRAALGAREDRAFVEAWARAPRAKVGRPVIVLGCRLEPGFRQRLGGAGLGVDELSWFAASFAVGDGFDLGVVAGLSSPAAAERARVRLQQGLAAVARSSWGRALSLERYLQPVVLVTRKERLHGAFRLSAPRLAGLLGRADSVAERSEASHGAR